MIWHASLVSVPQEPWLFSGLISMAFLALSCRDAYDKRTVHRRLLHGLKLYGNDVEVQLFFIRILSLHLSIS